MVSAKLKYSTGESTGISHYVNKTSWGIPFSMGVKFNVSPSYSLTTQVYVYSDINTLSKTNKKFGAYNYIYPGLRITIDKNSINLKK